MPRASFLRSYMIVIQSLAVKMATCGSIENSQFINNYNRLSCHETIFNSCVKLPLVDVSTDPLDLMVTGLALRMKQLARTSPKFIELVHERQFRIQIGTDLGMARQIIVNNGQIDTVSGDAEKADFILQFADSEQGVKTLIKGDPTAFMTGMQSGSIKMEGDFGLLVWFNQVAKLVPPKLPKPVKAKIKAAHAFLKEKTGK